MWTKVTNFSGMKLAITLSQLANVVSKSLSYQFMVGRCTISNFVPYRFVLPSSKSPQDTNTTYKWRNWRRNSGPVGMCPKAFWVPDGLRFDLKEAFTTTAKASLSSWWPWYRKYMYRKYMFRLVDIWRVGSCSDALTFHRRLCNRTIGFIGPVPTIKDYLNIDWEMMPLVSV